MAETILLYALDMWGIRKSIVANNPTQEGERGRAGNRRMDEIRDFQTLKPVSFPGTALVIKGEVHENCSPRGKLLLKIPTSQNLICKEDILTGFDPRRVAVDMLTACSRRTIKSKSSRSYFPTFSKRRLGEKSEKEKSDNITYNQKENKLWVLGGATWPKRRRREIKGTAANFLGSH